MSSTFKNRFLRKHIKRLERSQTFEEFRDLHIAYLREQYARTTDKTFIAFEWREPESKKKK
jgi:hypothetical protein